MWQRLAWGCASSWWFFSYPGFKGEASERCCHTALGPTFKGSCSLGCALQNQATGCRPPAENTVQQLAYEFLQVNQLSYRCQLYETWLCLRTQNFASTVTSVTFPKIQTRLVPWKPGVGRPECPWLQVQAMLYWEAWGLLPKDLASGYPHPSLEVFPTPSGVFTKALQLSATWILHHHPAPANSLEWGWWTGSSWTVEMDLGWDGLPGKCPLQPPRLLRGGMDHLRVRHSGGRAASGSSIHRLGDPASYWPSLVFRYLSLKWWWSYWPHKMM